MSDAHSAAVIPLLRATAVDAYADLVAFLFSDIEGSSLKWLNHRAAMQEALRAHDDILRSAISAHGGEVFKTGVTRSTRPFGGRRMRSALRSRRSRRSRATIGRPSMGSPFAWPFMSGRPRSAEATISARR
jgi:class 3 adenylate cyclase